MDKEIEVIEKEIGELESRKDRLTEELHTAQTQREKLENSLAEAVLLGSNPEVLLQEIYQQDDKISGYSRAIHLASERIAEKQIRIRSTLIEKANQRLEIYDRKLVGKVPEMAAALDQVRAKFEEMRGLFTDAKAIKAECPGADFSARKYYGPMAQVLDDLIMLRCDLEKASRHFGGDMNRVTVELNRLNNTKYVSGWGEVKLMDYENPGQ
jgi:hypothetical protein